MTTPRLAYFRNGTWYVRSKTTRETKKKLPEDKPKQINKQNNVQKKKEDMCFFPPVNPFQRLSDWYERNWVAINMLLGAFIGGSLFLNYYFLFLHECA
jgi:hypothetical protein